MPSKQDLCACGQPKDPRAQRCKACFLAEARASETKWCSGCETSHPLDAFGRRKSKIRSKCRDAEAREARQWRADNPGKHAAAKRSWAERNPERQAIIALRRNAKALGLDPDDIEARFHEHNGLCDCCGQPPRTYKRLTIDHDHDRPGVFRGFICSPCNLMLGHAGDDPDRLMAGAAYLQYQNFLAQ